MLGEEQYLFKTKPNLRPGRFIVIQSSLMNLTLVHLYGPSLYNTLFLFTAALCADRFTLFSSGKQTGYPTIHVRTKDIRRLENPTMRKYSVIQPVTIAAVLQVTSLIRTLLSPELTVVDIKEFSYLTTTLISCDF